VATPLQGIATPTYAPDTFDQIATLAAALQVFDGTTWQPLHAGSSIGLNRTVQVDLASTEAATDTGGNITPGVTGTLGVSNLPSVAFTPVSFASGWGTPTQGPSVAQLAGVKYLASGLVGPTAAFALSNMTWQTIATTSIVPAQNLNAVGWHISLNIPVLCRWGTSGNIRIMVLTAAGSTVTIPAVSSTAYVLFPSGLTA